MKDNFEHITNIGSSNRISPGRIKKWFNKHLKRLKDNNHPILVACYIIVRLCKKCFENDSSKSKNDESNSLQYFNTRFFSDYEMPEVPLSNSYRDNNIEYYNSSFSTENQMQDGQANSQRQNDNKGLTEYTIVQINFSNHQGK